MALFAIVASLGSWLTYELYVLDLRARRRKGASAAKSRSVPASSPAYIRPRELWRLSQLEEYSGRQSTDGPILLAADGLVFNVASARAFYGPGGEYAVMAGTDASRYLAKNSVQPDTESEAATPLSLAERASLSAWVFSFRQKYDVVGRLATQAEAERIERSQAYIGQIEEMSASETDANSNPKSSAHLASLRLPLATPLRLTQSSCATAMSARERLESSWQSEGEAPNNNSSDPIP